MGPSLGFETEIIKEKQRKTAARSAGTWAREELEQGNMEAVSGLSRLHDTQFTARLSTVMHSAERSACRPSIRSRGRKAASAVRRLRFEVKIEGKIYTVSTNIGVKPTVQEKFTGEERIFGLRDLYGKQAEVLC